MTPRLLLGECQGLRGHHSQPVCFKSGFLRWTLCVRVCPSKWGETERVSRSFEFYSLQPHGLQPARLLCPWDSPGKNTGVGGHALLQGIFPTRRSSPGLLRCRQIPGWEGTCHPL